ncbi:hypothetical protein MQC88_11095 [Luteimonas sp. 50]|uniref:Uncharacterized protein n=1 Tax=Cognatiluteimonas sedimenti TaxID=2927791 RepID=A0ABT0A676_9GAMM|nr:hypothetical protein [Lysobacter sedimenti]MCJ0826489.1 hypothetical protein [Lysobacter sedimenti]
MDARIQLQTFLAAIGLLACGAACGGVIERAGTPGAWGGKFISCHAPEATLGVVRGARSTTVYQATAKGIDWKYVLPQTVGKSDQIWAAPDGKGAVIAVTMHQKGSSRNFHVSEAGPVEVDGGLVAVDYQADRVMIVTSAPRLAHTYRVRVFERSPWKLVGDSTFTSDFGDGFRRFSVRLTRDGQSYYYLDGAMAPTVRDAIAGQEVPLGFEFAPGGIDDLLLYSDADGFAVMGNRLYALRPNHALEVVPVPGRQYVDSLLETGDARLQPVRFAYGWGMLDRQARRWRMVSDDPVSAIHSQGAMLTVVNSPVGKDSVEVFDFSGSTPALVATADKPGPAQAVVCANPYGYMRYADGAFSWHRLDR